MQQETVTFEQIDAAFEKMAHAQPEGTATQLTAETVRANPSAAISRICPLYKSVRPFLQASASLPFIPPSWRAGIRAFIAGMDLLCP
jgi:hypothetical protein